MRAILTALSILVLLGWAATFAFFLSDTRRLGGDAINGRAEGGRWFVSDHGREREVSEDDWRGNRALAFAMFGVLLPAMAGGGWLLVREVFPRVIFLRDEAETAAAEARVRASGAPVAATRCAGRLAWVDFGGKFLRATVHPGGLHVKPVWMRAFGIDAARVRSVGRRRTLGRELVVVEHDAPDVRSPVILDCARDAAFTAALDRLVRR